MSKKINTSYRFCLYCGAKYTLTDAMGNPWCEEHRLRHDLINWGKEHTWPLVECQAAEETVDFRKNRFRYYAIGPGYDLWFTACSMGSEHMMDTLAATILTPAE